MAEMSSPDPIPVEVTSELAVEALDAADDVGADAEEPVDVVVAGVAVVGVVAVVLEMIELMAI